MKKFIRRSFMLLPAEKLLVFLLSKFPHNLVLNAVTPPNHYYPANSIRACRRQGVNYSLDIHDYQNWLLYFYSDCDSSFGVISYLKKGDIVLDIGGNIGQTALVMAGKIGSNGHIYSFEPYPATFEQLKRNLALNPAMSNNIHAENDALGAAPGTSKMYQDCITNNGANRMVPKTLTATNGQVEVPVSTIDIFVKQEELDAIDFIKIDVEGFEMQVLKGGHHTLVTFKPQLFIELDDNNLNKQGSSSLELCGYLQNLGYTICEVGKQEAFVPAKLSGMVNIYCIT